TCPTCYQKVNPDILKEAKSTFISKKEEQTAIINRTKEQITNLQDEQNKNKSRLSELNKDYKKIQRAQEGIGDLQNKINELQSSLSQLPETDSIEVYEEQIRTLDTKIMEERVEKRELEKLLEESEEEKINIDELEFQEKFLQLVEKKIEEYKKEVLEKKLNEVKDIIKDKWAQIWSKDIWSIDFDKNFVPTISYKEKDQTIHQTLRGLSGSEKIMLSVIMRAALLEKLMGTKTLILDDPSIFLDTENIKRAATFYRELIDQNHIDQIILTTFNKDFMDYLQPDQVIELD
ncbi:MAG: hypothetical protein ACTSQE_14435, partial [Candidatus Heimdallarchaeaceae archaeon]